MRIGWAAYLHANRESVEARVATLERAGCQHSVVLGALVGYGAGAAGRSRHVKRLIALRHWARSLDLAERPITFHVLEGAAEALIDQARDNAIDHLVRGTRGVTGVRRRLGGVALRVVAEANGTVTVASARSATSANSIMRDTPLRL